MKKISKIVALLLTLVLLSSTMMCFAVDSEKKYYDYDKALILGDSEASGFSDYGHVDSEFNRVDDSYAAYVADDVGAELVPMACPGFRTIELRYLLDDNYRPDDKFLFAKVPNTPKDQLIAKAPEVKQAIKDSDLIMICIGGNDWGGYLGWVLAEVELENELPKEYKDALKEYLMNAKVGDDIIEKIIDLADYLNAVDDIAKALPEAISYAFEHLEANWKYIVEYIYENNPDATLVAVGLFPSYYKTEPGAPDVVTQPNELAKLVENGIIANGNKYMVNYQKEYGYIYVETKGTVVEDSHPTPAGHRHVADIILNALPDKRFQYTEDVALRNPNFTAIEYMTIYGYMTGTSETTFSPDDVLTESVLSVALNKITGTYKITDSTSAVSKLKLAYTLFSITDKNEFFRFIDVLNFTIRLLTTGDNKITRAEGAGALYSYILNFIK